MTRCWASVLGDCDGGISGEHIFSRVLFPKGAFVRGFDWCKVDLKRVGADALVANRLCAGHNSLLSPLDQAAADLRYSMMAIATQMNAQSSSSPERHYKIDGTAFERWCFKVACNVYSCGAFIGLTDWTPPDEVVRFVFGKGNLPPGCGLGALAKTGMGQDNDDHLQFVPLGKEKDIIGAIITLRGQPYVCSWGHPVEELLAPAESQNTPTPLEAIYHLEKIEYDGPALSFAFDWQGTYDNSSNPHVVEARNNFAITRKKKKKATQAKT